MARNDRNTPDVDLSKAIVQVVYRRQKTRASLRADGVVQGDYVFYQM